MHVEGNQTKKSQVSDCPTKDVCYRGCAVYTLLCDFIRIMDMDGLKSLPGALIKRHCVGTGFFFFFLPSVHYI